MTNSPDNKDVEHLADRLLAVEENFATLVNGHRKMPPDKMDALVRARADLFAALIVKNTSILARKQFYIQALKHVLLIAIGGAVPLLFTPLSGWIAHALLGAK